MGHSRIAWAGMAVAPWGLALGLLVSITARAGQEFDVAGAPLTRAAFDVTAANPAPALIVARYEVGAGEDLRALPDEIEPNAALKPKRAGLPTINSAGKGDPIVALRPGFEGKARAARAASLASGDDAGWSADSRSPAGAIAERQPSVIVYSDGATPSLPLEFALNTATPRASDSKLRLVGPAGSPRLFVSAGVVQFGQPNPPQPHYATLIDPKDSARQMRCLAEAIYFEARSEPEVGQAAVAQVVLNRVRSGIFPTDVCGVVYQDAKRPFACQFSFACEGKSLRVEEPAAWATATRLAKDVVDGTNYNAKLVEAVNYHATYVAPFWAGSMRRVEKIGLHIFYTMRPGLYWAPGALNGRGDLPPLQAAAK